MRRQAIAQASRRNAEALIAWECPAAARRWKRSNREYLESNERASDRFRWIGCDRQGHAHDAAVRRPRRRRVSCHQQQATAGIIIAGSILSARALAPVDLAIAHWKGFVAARQSWRRLNRLLGHAARAGVRPCWTTPARSPSRASPSPSRRPENGRAGCHLRGRGRTGRRRHRSRGSGKSSLARALVGVWQPRGAIAARRRGARSVVAGGPRPPYRLPAAGRGTVCGHHRPEHFALRGRCDPQHHRSGRAKRASTI